MAKKASKPKTSEVVFDAPPLESETVSKSEAVRRALAAGADQPTDGIVYIKTHFGLDISPTHFSAVKSAHLKKQGGGVRVRINRGPKPTPGIPANGEADLLEAMEAIKSLVASLGVDRVKRLADLLG